MITRKLYVPFALTMGLLALVGTLILLGAWGSVETSLAQPGATNRYVSSISGVDTGNCATASAPCKTIQYAVDQAGHTDDIYVATYEVVLGLSPVTTTARYTGTGNNVIELTGSDLQLHGGYVYIQTSGTWIQGIVPAEVDGEGVRRAIYIKGVTPTLELLSFVNGYAGWGGNVYAEDANVTFRATPVLSGVAEYGGGGIYLKNCRTSFDAGNLSLGNLLGIADLLPVQNNNAFDAGGGIYVDGGAPVLSGLYVNANSATRDGGGFYLNGGRPIIAAGLVMGNHAGNRGGGFYLSDSPARIAATAVYSNVAAAGGGFYLDGPFSFSEYTVPLIANNYVRHNSTGNGGQGGGFYFRQAIAGLVNNIVADNAASDGAALYLWASSPQLFHNTIAQNTGNHGIYATHKPGSIWPPIIPIPSQPSFTNTIIVSQTVGVYVDSTGLPAPLQNEVTLYGTLWNGNGSDTAGAGTVVHSTDVYSAPKFTCTGDPPGCLNPYHILTDSAAVDAGVLVALTLPGSDLFVDIDLQLRPSGDGYDIGADEVVNRDYSVWLIPSVSVLPAEPGQTVTHTHLLMNTGLQTDTYTVTSHSDTGWATLLAASPVTLAAQTSTTLQVVVSVPSTATNGMRDTTVITAASPNARANGLDVTAVLTGTVGDLVVDKRADVEGVSPGEVVRFTIAVTKTGLLTGTLLVTDTAVPTAALSLWRLPAACTGVTVTGQVTCAWTLPPGGSTFTRTFDIVITTTAVYSGLLINKAEVGADGVVIEENYDNNEAQVAVAVADRKIEIYLPLVLKNS